MTVAFVIPNYIATDELKELATNTIASMRKTSDVYIISVDDGSPMDTKFLEEISDHTIHLEKNSGFAVACNTGLQYALDKGYEYIGCANNDIEVFNGWIEAMLYPFSKYVDCGITGLISSKLRNLNGIPIEEYKEPKITSGGLLNDKMQSGGLWLSTHTVLEDIGLFDERFLVGGEDDVDLFLRIRQKYDIIMSGHSCFWHKEGATRWNDEIEKGYLAKNKAIEDTNYDKFADKWGWDIRKDGLRFYEEVLE